MPSKDIKMSNEVDEAFRGINKMKIAKEAEIKKFGNDKDRKILALIKTNLNIIVSLDLLSQKSLIQKILKILSNLLNHYQFL